MLEIRVGKREGADYCTIQEAIEAVPYESEARIVVEEGVYEEKLFCDKARLSIKGLGSVVITWSDSARTIMPDGKKRGTFRSYTAFFSGHHLRLENLTIKNEAGIGAVAGQAVALYLDVDDAELNNVHLYGHQDTLFLAPLPEKEREERGFYGPRHLCERKLNHVLCRGGSIEGGVDFIFGGADALFERVEIISNEEGYVAAPSGYEKDLGFIFRRCHFTHRGLKKASVYLMRPWREEGKCTFVDCSYEDHINPDGLSPWVGKEDEVEKCTFRHTNGSFARGEVINEKDSFVVVNKFFASPD